MELEENRAFHHQQHLEEIESNNRVIQYYASEHDIQGINDLHLPKPPSEYSEPSNNSSLANFRKRHPVSFNLTPNQSLHYNSGISDLSYLLIFILKVHTHLHCKYVQGNYSEITFKKL